ncbi:hypothetical protein C4K40_1748 [Pseudomonas sp. CMR5c]|nr:hypothetical protein C4K40_1748 [Pseudomonas sp. CMR5c]
MAWILGDQCVSYWLEVTGSSAGKHLHSNNHGRKLTMIDLCGSWC